MSARALKKPMPSSARNRRAGQAEAERERLLAAERAQARRQAALFRLSAELAAHDEARCRRVVDGLRDTLGYDFVALPAGSGQATASGRQCRF